MDIWYIWAPKYVVLLKKVTLSVNSGQNANEHAHTSYFDLNLNFIQTAILAITF